MALNKGHDPHLENLILQAAADVVRMNPHIGTAEQRLPAADYAEIERELEELTHLWDAMERERNGPLEDEPAARAVNDDRGE